MKPRSPTLFAFAAFPEASRRFGVRVRRVAVVAIFAPLDGAAVEYRAGGLVTGGVLPFARLATRPADLRPKMRAAFPALFSRLGKGSPAASSAVANAAV